MRWPSGSAAASSTCEAGCTKYLKPVIRFPARSAKTSPVQRLFSSFPTGRPGIGLLLLRLTASVFLVLQSRNSFDGRWPSGFIGVMAIVTAVLLTTGFLTPIAGILGGLTVLLAGGPAYECLLALAVVVFLLGPGAYSVDARLFGRLEIVIPRQK